MPKKESTRESVNRELLKNDLVNGYRNDNGAPDATQSKGPDLTQSAMLADPRFMDWWKHLQHAIGAQDVTSDTPPLRDPRIPGYDMMKLFKSGWQPDRNFVQQRPLMQGGNYFSFPGSETSPDSNPDTAHTTRFRSDSHPQAIVHGIDTRTGQRVAPRAYTGPMTDGMRRNAVYYSQMQAPDGSRASERGPIKNPVDLIKEAFIRMQTPRAAAPDMDAIDSGKYRGSDPEAPEAPQLLLGPTP